MTRCPLLITAYTCLCLYTVLYFEPLVYETCRRHLRCICTHSRIIYNHHIRNAPVKYISYYHVRSIGTGTFSSSLGYFYTIHVSGFKIYLQPWQCMPLYCWFWWSGWALFLSARQHQVSKMLRKSRTLLRSRTLMQVLWYYKRNIY